MRYPFIYGFVGKYTARSQYQFCDKENSRPIVSATHQCLLFIDQTSNTRDIENAEIEGRKYGFSNITVLSGAKLDINFMATDDGRYFSECYQAALDQGSALMFISHKSRKSHTH
jgi:IS30 family transposase